MDLSSGKFYRNTWNKLKSFALFSCTLLMVLSFTKSAQRSAITFPQSSHNFYLKQLKKFELPTHKNTTFESVQFLKETESSENDKDSNSELDYFFIYSFYTTKSTLFPFIPKLFYLVDQPYFVKTHIALFLLFHSWKSFLP